ncbi:MAG: ATP-grasp domain-containing protein [Chitinophagales bacterium]|nr:ATP-grasp domain-containing protein [Chitinophagales bacterium]
MKRIHWILQSNLIREQTLNQIKNALVEDNVSFEEVRVIPFSDELPTIERKEDINVFYGSTTLILNAYKKWGTSEGIFYDHRNFNMKTYLEKWGVKMLNSDSKIFTFKEIVALKLRENSVWFLRPIEDDKSFSGCIMTFKEIIDFEKKLLDSNNPYLSTETLVAISSVKSISKEWRLFIIDKMVVSACRYMLNGSLDIDDKDIPKELIVFAEECCREYVPADIFVMDIAFFKERFHIVECNCFNDSGFYKHDILKIIHGVNEYFERCSMLNDKLN